VATPKTRRSVTTTQPIDNGGRSDVRNQILLALPALERETLFQKLEFIEMPTRFILHEAGEPITHAYFVNDGLASVLSVMKDGKSVEVGLTGREGFIGLPLVIGFSTSGTQVVMQVKGSAYRIASSDFKDALPRCRQLELALNRFVQSLSLQAVQIAACNRVHEVDERLARWLLMSQDRLGGDIVPLTQEFLAHMLGTRRASVTIAAGHLQKAGLITYNRGSVKILDRSRLEDAACECYSAIVLQSERWARETIPKRA
jgi:CRP-like cAMP-binding protein